MSNRTKPASHRPASKASPRGILLTGVLVVVVVGLLVTLITLTSRPTTSGATSTAAGESSAQTATLGSPVPAELLVRPDSRRLGAPAGDRVQLVEFLDLECEACRAAFPTVERLKAEYAGRVDFVVRYFPIPSHLNAEAAAFATEAAGRQGRFEAMYQMMYQTQADWGDQQVSHAGTFRGFAAQLGLDLARYDADVADPALQQRVLADREDGTAAGVQGTPTFFLNDRPVDDVSGYASLKALLDQALAAP